MGLGAASTLPASVSPLQTLGADEFRVLQHSEPQPPSALTPEH